jgi:hypothetical protein
VSSFDRDAWGPCASCGWVILEGDTQCPMCRCEPDPPYEGTIPSRAYRGAAPFVAESETSASAAASIEAHAGAMRWRVYRYVTERSGATCDEVEVALGMSHQTASARIRELVLGGWLVRSAVKRKTRSGRAADVIVDANTSFAMEDA